jgi:hypothetical protein
LPKVGQFSTTVDKVILDAALAALYGVETKNLNQAVKRNEERFPQDFVFQLTEEEWTALRSQLVTSKKSGNPEEPSKRGGRRWAPYAFTEHGAIMASSILNSPEATRMSLYVVRAFIKQREFLMAHADLLSRLAQIDAKLLQHDEVLRAIVTELQPLLNPPPNPPAKEMGFHVKGRGP